MTEKDYNPNQKEKNAMKKQPKAKLVENLPKENSKKPEDKAEEKVEQNIEDKKENEAPEKEEQEVQVNSKKNSEGIQKTEDKKRKKEKGEIKKSVKKIKKEEVYVNAKSVPISTKYAINICKFVKGKRIGDAIRDLEQVALLKKPVPMKGEYSHRKGKGISGGTYPKRASEYFIVLLKSLAGNANNHEILEPIIVEARANWAPGPRGRFGTVRRKRTHVTLKAAEMKIKENKKQGEKK